MSSEPSKPSQQWPMRRRDDLEQHVRKIEEETSLLSHGSTRALSPTLRDETSLCRRCAAINPGCLSAQAINDGLAKDVETHNPRYPFEASCSLCQLLSANVPYVDDGFAISLGPVLERDVQWLPHKGLVFRISYGPWVKRRRYLVPKVGAECTVRVLQPDHVSFDVVKEWIQFCSKEHHDTCGLESRMRVPPLRLIDCETRRIIPAGDLPYVCLSYVWGQSTGDNSFVSVLPQGLPTTIEDAITATLGVGMRYLWIDRYCIDQQNQANVSLQIQMMDLIYQNAELTIIAAAGSDPWYGLPGIGPRIRQAQQTSGKIWDIVFVPPATNPIESVQNSAWATRGWTFQEALFSRRRLVFTDHQVYFECNRFGCAESLNIPLSDWNERSSGCFIAPHNLGTAAFEHGTGIGAQSVFHAIGHYSSRKLTKPSDAINGIRGTLRAYEAKYAIHHCWGVPSLLFYSETAPSETLFVDGLCWSTYRAHSRRAGFPSWSWAGWYGPVSWPSYFYKTDPCEAFKPSDGIELRFELGDGRVVPWQETQAAIRQAESQAASLSTVVHISAWTTPIRMRSLKKDSKSPRLETAPKIKHTELDNDSSDYQAEVLLGGKHTELGQCGYRHTGRFSELPEHCIGINMGSWRVFNYGDDRSPVWKPQSTVLLVVGETAEGKMERIGLAEKCRFRRSLMDWSWRTIRLG
ncbi:hypothetical protein VTI74DRAFT_6244 [Chaetomium olivicolor]